MTPAESAIHYRALSTRDARFDGRLFVGVTSTGIYCRPVCPARTPRAENCRFYVTAAAAEAAGFRPCLRCRPETAPEHGAWRGTSNTVARGLELIAAGALDGEAGVEQLAERLGVGERQLRRLFEQLLGASPVAVAQTRRVAFAKQLIQETALPLTEVAQAAGFGSVRRFNEVFATLFGRPPRALRRGRVAAGAEPGPGAAAVVLRVRYRAPYDWPALLAFLRARAIAGVERVREDRYLRSFAEGGEAGSVEVRHVPEAHSLQLTVRAGRVQALPLIVNRVRRVFDVASDMASIAAHLGRDPVLAPLLAARPGLRVPGGWDGFELGVRALLGQQVSVAAARQLGERLVRACGSPFPAGSSELGWLFPTPEQVARADLSQLGAPRLRIRALQALAEAALAEPRLFEPAATLEATLARLLEVPGVGDWTAHYIALRGAREPDAFPASDRGLLRAIERCTGVSEGAQALEQRSQAWRPWRAYAAQQLWAADPGMPVAPPFPAETRAAPRARRKST